MLPLIIGPALRDLIQAAPGIAGVHAVGGPALLDSGDRRRRVRSGRRLSHRSAGPPPCPRLEHPDLCLLGVRRGVQHEHLAVPVLPLHDVDRRVRRVRRRHRLAGRALLRSQTARACARLHAGVLVGGRPHGHGRELSLRAIRPIAAGHPRRARGLALHADLRRDSGASAHHHPPVPAGVAGVAAEARRRARFAGPASPPSSAPSSAARRSSRR